LGGRAKTAAAAPFVASSLVLQAAAGAVAAVCGATVAARLENTTAAASGAPVAVGTAASRATVVDDAVSTAAAGEFLQCYQIFLLQLLQTPIDMSRKDYSFFEYS
jgi:hypothetical protein